MWLASHGLDTPVLRYSHILGNLLDLHLLPRKIVDDPPIENTQFFQRVYQYKKKCKLVGRRQISHKMVFHISSKIQLQTRTMAIQLAIIVKNVKITSNTKICYTKQAKHRTWKIHSRLPVYCTAYCTVLDDNASIHFI